MDHSYYSQFAQDRILDTYLFRGFRGGTFLDIGAHDGRSLSNSLFFEESRQWTGVCVEADPASYSRLTRQRQNVVALNVAVGKTEGVAAFVQVTGYPQMLSGFADSVDLRRIDREIAQQGGSKNVIEVPVRQVRTILGDQGISEIHYASIDIEGAELEALESFDWNAVFVHALTVECNTERNAARVTAMLGSRGIANCGRDGADLFFVNRKSQFFPNHESLSRELALLNRQPVHIRLRRLVGSAMRSLGLRR